MKRSSVKKMMLQVTEKAIRIGAKEYYENGPWCMGLLHQPQRPKNKPQTKETK